MDTVSVSCEIAFCQFVSNTCGFSRERRLTAALSTILLSKRQHVTTVATPVGANIGELLETMRNAMIDLLLIRISLRIGFTDTLRNHARVTFRVAGVLAVLALHTGRVLEEVAAKCTSHDIVKLLRHELVTEHLVDQFLTLANGSLTVKSNIEWPPILGLLDKAER